MAKYNGDGVPRLLWVVIGFVGTAWFVSIGVDMFNPRYDPPDTIGLAFMAVLSTLLGIVVASQRDSGNGKDDDNEGEG